MTFAFESDKVVFGVVNLNFSDFFEFSSVNATRGHAYKLYKPSCVNNTRNRDFAERIVNVWNFLPSSVNFSTLSAFSRSILRIDFSLFLKCVTDLFYLYFSRAAISVLAVPLDLFCCTCYFANTLMMMMMMMMMSIE